MELYIICGLSILIFAFLISLSVQLIRIEKSITKLALFVEKKVANLFNPEG